MSKLILITCILFTSLIWGTTFAGNKFIMEQGVDPLLLAFLRLIIAILCLLPFYKRFQEDTCWTLKDWLRIAFIGSFLCSVALILEYTGTKYTSASNVSVIVSTDALVTTLLSVLILKERLTFSTIVGGICAMTGIALLIAKDIRNFNVSDGYGLYGDLLVFACVFCWSLYTVLSKPVVRLAHPIYTLFFVTLFSSFSLGIVTLCNGSLTRFHIPLAAWPAIIYLGIFGSCVAYILYFLALKHLPVSLVTLSLTSLPVIGVLSSIYLLNESLGHVQVLGIFMILVGLAYAMWPLKTNKHDVKEQNQMVTP